MRQLAQILALLASCASLSVCAGLAPGQTLALPEAPHGVMEQWIADLDSHKYDARMTATRELASCGEPAVPLLMTALQDRPSMELQVRGFEVLVRIAREQMAKRGGSDLDGGAAEVALVELAHGGTGAFAVRAQQKLTVLRDAQREVAAEQLSKLGASVAKKPFTFFGGGRFEFRCLALGKTWSGTARDLHRLKYLDDVDAISMDGPFVSDEYLRVLSTHAPIRLVEIKHALIQNDSLQLLRELPQLQFLNFYYTPLTDEAVSMLVDLAPQSLLLFGTRISEAGYQSLMTKLPNALVDFRRGAFLGIGGSELPIPQSLGCEVNQVARDSAAARAGIVLGDIIVSYDGKPVRCFEEIREMIGRNAAGDQVEVELLRNNQKMKIMVALGEWE